MKNVVGPHMNAMQNSTKIKSPWFSKTDMKASDSKEHTVSLSKTRFQKKALSHSTLYQHITPSKYL